jgi:hypothetical protein
MWPGTLNWSPYGLVNIMAGYVKMKLRGVHEVQRELEKLAKRAALVGESFADYAAAVTQKMVVRNVQPFGLDGKPKLLGEYAVSRGLNNAFKPVRRRGKNVIDSVSAARTFHKGVRDSRGRVAHKRAFRKKIYYPVFMAFLREQQAKVGAAKGSFSGGSTRLGNKHQKWITRHDKGSTITRSRGRRGVVWQFDSAVPYTNSGHVMGERGIKRVFSKQKHVLMLSLKGKLRRAGISV